MTVVTIEHRGPVSVIAINRPEKLNAINKAVAVELQLAFGEFDRSAQHGDGRVAVGRGQPAPLGQLHSAEADALDRTHSARILRVDATAASEAVFVEVHAAGNWDAERAAFTLKRDMLQAAAKRPVLVKAAD